MKGLGKYIEGDRAIWAVVILLAVASFLPVYSASSNIAYLYGDGNTSRFLIKHFGHVLIGLIMLFVAHRVPPKFYNNLSLLLLPISCLLLVIVLIKGQTIGEANASRWLTLPFIQFSFQPSEIAKLAILMYVARYISRNRDKLDSFKETFVPLILPVVLVCGLILPANLSTAALIFFLCLMLMILGNYAWKNVFKLLGLAVAGLVLFIVFIMAFPGISNRVDTWKSRIESFADGGDYNTSYQVEKSKIAIASGGIYGKGPGKSIQKNFLPQSTSDFIYAVIVEEGGLIAGLSVIFLYAILFMRVLRMLSKIPDIYASLLAFGLGFSIVFQALSNMAVAVNVFPVTGQTLPFLSSGGTSLWVSCFMVGIILSMSKLQVVEEKVEPIAA